MFRRHLCRAPLDQPKITLKILSVSKTRSAPTQWVWRFSCSLSSCRFLFWKSLLRLSIGLTAFVLSENNLDLAGTPEIFCPIKPLKDNVLDYEWLKIIKGPLFFGGPTLLQRRSLVNPSQVIMLRRDTLWPSNWIKKLPCIKGTPAHFVDLDFTLRLHFTAMIGPSRFVEESCWCHSHLVIPFFRNSVSSTNTSDVRSARFTGTPPGYLSRACCIHIECCTNVASGFFVFFSINILRSLPLQSITKAWLRWTW